MWPLFEHSAAAADVGTIVGAVTLLIAATIGLAVTDLKRVIAYSTMSQIGYMIMAVSAGAYAAGLFHLMTHAFFKALLFMAAGSLIGAMAGVQALDRMSGFRKAMPFTFACFVIGGLALAAVPPFSGFFSKDEILLFIGHRGGWHWILYVLGYLGSMVTAIYTFRMIFRAFWGEPSPEAVELQNGHMHHADVPANPATGEEEDTDVGFPGAEHHIAERSLPMKAAMGLLAVLAVIGGFVQIPKVTEGITKFLDPTFADSKYAHDSTPDGLLVIGLILGAVLGVVGILIAYRVWVQKPGTATAVRERLSALHGFLTHKWYFDEVIDFAIVRPSAWVGRFAQQRFERVVINGVFTNGTTGVVRAGSAAVRAAQTGFLRYYAAFLLFGLAGVGLYFLIVSS
jgi:NADH-quinone oxidoreductase subunit L